VSYRKWAISLDDCRVPEENRLQADISFPTREGAAYDASRGGVMSTGCGMGAYEHSLAYAQTRSSSGGRSSFQLVQDLLAKMIGNGTASQCMWFAFPKCRTKA